MGDGGNVTRHVREDLAKVVTDDNPVGDMEVEDPNEISMMYSQGGALSAYGGDDDFEDFEMPKFNYSATSINENYDLKKLHAQLQSFRDEEACAKDKIKPQSVD